MYVCPSLQAERGGLIYVASYLSRDETSSKNKNKTKSKLKATQRYVNKSTPIAIDTEEAQRRNELRRL